MNVFMNNIDKIIWVISWGHIICSL